MSAALIIMWYTRDLYTPFTHLHVIYIEHISNTEDIAELKSLILGLDGKVSGLSKQLDTIETKITNMSEKISEVKAAVTSVKTDLKNTQHHLKCIKDSHEEQNV